MCNNENLMYSDLLIEISLTFNGSRLIFALIVGIQKRRELTALSKLKRFLLDARRCVSHEQHRWGEARRWKNDNKKITFKTIIFGERIDNRDYSETIITRTSTCTQYTGSHTAAHLNTRIHKSLKTASHYRTNKILI